MDNGVGRAYELARKLSEKNFKLEYIYVYGGTVRPKEFVLEVPFEKFEKLKKSEIIIDSINDGETEYGLSGIYGGKYHVMVAKENEIARYKEIYGFQVIDVYIRGLGDIGQPDSDIKLLEVVKVDEMVKIVQNRIEDIERRTG